VPAFTLVAVGLCNSVMASDASPDRGVPPEHDTLEEVIVSVTPLLGTGVPLNHVPSNVQTLRAAQIDSDHSQALTDSIDRHLSSVTLADTEGNAFQQDLVARGFIASPVLGTPQGLALYQNGVRINEAFGDIVLWDFVPSFAISQLQELPGSNPVFGLNALGGAVTLKMKDGFAYSGSAADIDGGSFGRVRATAQTATDWNDQALYVGAMYSHEDGWRQFSQSKVWQSFADYAARRDDFSFGASLTGASSDLNGNGANPAQDDRTAAFAIPDTERNRLAFLQLRAGGNVAEGITLQGTAYARSVDIDIENGGASGFTPCGETVCDDSGPLTLIGGGSIPTNLPYSGDFPIQNTHSEGFGGAFQTTIDRPVGGLGNVLNMGITVDQGNTRFRSSNWLGDLVYLSPPGTATLSDGVQIGGEDYNVRLDTTNRYYGAFLSDTWSASEALSVTLAGRYNLATIDMTDLFGASLNGDHSYARLNPSIGATYQLDSKVNVYASYGEANRIPTAAELSCADPTQPCRFPLGFVSDPNLRQVVARTVELGARSHAARGGDLSIDWTADVYGTRNQDDILFVSAGPLIGSGYFRNAGDTLRLGTEAALEGTWQKLDFHANYGFVRATYLSHLTVLSANNPAADANGNIFVQPGDRLPEIPMHTFKLGAGYRLSADLQIGMDARWVSTQYLRGDEANLQPPLAGYAVVDAHATWQATRKLSIFLEAENLFNRRYNSFGLYGDPTGNGAFPNFTNPRFYTPGQPVGCWLGGKFKY
jgi:iron complex outermembrane receptor protein